MLSAPLTDGADYTRDYVFDGPGNEEILALMKATGFGGEGAACIGCTGTDQEITDGFVVGVQATVVNAIAVPPVISIRTLEFTGSTTDTTEYCTVVETTEPSTAPVTDPTTSGASSIKASLLLLASWVALF
jgi:hypothetical protein